MDGRDAMSLSGSASYYIHRGVSDSVSRAQSGVLNAPPGHRSSSNVHVSMQSTAHGNSARGTFQIHRSPGSFTHCINMSATPSSKPSQPVKKKRGRARKYVPEETMALIVFLLRHQVQSLQARNSLGGRPPGTGRKQQIICSWTLHLRYFYLHKRGQEQYASCLQVVQFMLQHYTNLHHLLILLPMRVISRLYACQDLT